MKTIKFLSVLFVSSLLFVGCNNNDDDTPEPVNEEEVITTLTVTLIPQGGGDPISWASRDLDGDGPNDPVIAVSGPLAANTTYDGVVILLNETEDPAENITEEVEEEDDEHQMFYIVSGGLNVTTDYTNFDGDGNPLGTQFTLETGEASNGTVNVVLRHEPKKPNDGSLGDAGGETDISVNFSVTVQ